MPMVFYVVSHTVPIQDRGVLCSFTYRPFHRPKCWQPSPIPLCVFICAYMCLHEYGIHTKLVSINLFACSGMQICKLCTQGSVHLKVVLVEVSTPVYNQYNHVLVMNNIKLLQLIRTMENVGVLYY